MTKNQAEINLEDFNKVYAELKNLLKQSSDEDIEEYIRITKEQSYVADEDRLRQQFYEIRDESDISDISNLNPFDESKAIKIKSKVTTGKEFPFTELDFK